jgi:hypothetical protein
MNNFDIILNYIRSKIEESTIREEAGEDPFELYDDETSKRNKALATSEIKKILNGFIQKMKGIVGPLDDKSIKEVVDTFYSVLHVYSGEPISPENYENIKLKIEDEAKGKLVTLISSTSKKLNRYKKYGVGDTATDEAIATYIKRRLQGSGMEESVNEEEEDMDMGEDGIPAEEMPGKDDEDELLDTEEDVSYSDYLLSRRFNRKLYDRMKEKLQKFVADNKKEIPGLRIEISMSAKYQTPNLIVKADSNEVLSNKIGLVDDAIEEILDDIGFTFRGGEERSWGYTIDFED